MFPFVDMNNEFTFIKSLFTKRTYPDFLSEIKNDDINKNVSSNRSNSNDIIDLPRKKKGRLAQRIQK